ncbi:MAG: DUF2312 domain-containing protein [Paracoccaceae bacterium]
MDGSNGVSGSQLSSFIERIERLQSEKKIIGDDITVVFAEAKAAGFTPRYMRAIIKLRKKTPSERDEDDAMLDLYLSAVGMARETPLFSHVQGMSVDVAAREKVIEALKLLAPSEGEIVVKTGGGPRIRIWRDKEGVHSEEVKDVPSPATRPDQGGPKRMQRPGEDAPDCTEDQAHDLGRRARQDDQAITANPFAWDDKRRRRWDEGWRAEDGGDGMGPK